MLPTANFVNLLPGILLFTPQDTSLVTFIKAVWIHGLVLRALVSTSLARGEHSRLDLSLPKITPEPVLLTFGTNGPPVARGDDPLHCKAMLVVHIPIGSCTVAVHLKPRVTRPRALGVSSGHTCDWHPVADVPKGRLVIADAVGHPGLGMG